MNCLEKRHVSHRAGGMLHHRFPNGFTELFMDDTDREVSALTDRAFRSLCIGDDAVYNDEFSYGYSPFSCHKPVAEEPQRKTKKETKKQGHHHGQNGSSDAKPWKQQQHKNMSQVSSFLKALSATEESREGMLLKNGDIKDSNGESWDKTALRSIQRELSEFSPDYQNNLSGGHFSQKNHHHNPSRDGSAKKRAKDAALPSGKSSKIKNGKSTIKLRKLNIKNFFLHSEFSPFKTWQDFNQFPFSQEDIVTSLLPTDNIAKWYDSPLYKELTEAHRIETLLTEEPQPCKNVAVEPTPPPPPPPKPAPAPPPPPPKVLPKPSATPAERRCSSDSSEGMAAPWRRNRSRATSAVPVNQPGIFSPPQDSSSKMAEESLLPVKEEARSVEVKAVEEASSLASTPFSICQLMTPIIPSRQPTETSEVLQAVLSPLALDLPLRPDSEAKLTPETPVKRESYKSLASSILFNLKDNRKRVKSRYSPPKFKTSELPDRGTQSPRLDSVKYIQGGSEGSVSGFSTPAILKDRQTITCSPVLDPANTPSVHLQKCDADMAMSDDYLMSNLLQTKREAVDSRSLSEENYLNPTMYSKQNKSPMANKQNYPSLSLYKKASPIDNEMSHLHVPLSNDSMAKEHLTAQNKGLLSHIPNKGVSPSTVTANTGLSPNMVPVDKGHSCNGTPSSKGLSPYVHEKERPSSNSSVTKKSLHISGNTKMSVKDNKEKESGKQPVISKEKGCNGQSMSTVDVIKAAKEAISAAKNKALPATQLENSRKSFSDIGDPWENQIDDSKELVSNERQRAVAEGNRAETKETAIVSKREPPPVPKRNFTKSDVQLALDKPQASNDDELTNGDLQNAKPDLLAPTENEPNKTQGKFKHIFSARQNNYIKSQRYAVAEEEQGEECEEDESKVNARAGKNEEIVYHKEKEDSERIINDLHALKELERARLGDHILENAKSKLAVINIEEEAKAKNDLISRELRNIKKGMMSLRGNTLAKRDIFAKKEQEQSKHELFSKIDSNVIVNKALLNDNYDKAKMALEEIIEERLKNKQVKQQDVNLNLEESHEDESYATKLLRQKKATRDAMMEGKGKQTGTMSALREKELSERLGDLRDHNQMKQILSQTEPKLGETHRSGIKVALPGIDRVNNELNQPLTAKSKHKVGRHDTIIDDLSQFPNPEEENKRHIVRQMSDENGENELNESEGGTEKTDVPPVPPRSKKGMIKKDESKEDVIEGAKNAVEEEVSNKDSENNNTEAHSVKDMTETELEVPTKETEHVANNSIKKSIALPDLGESGLFLLSKHPQTENKPSCLSLKEDRADESRANFKEKKISSASEATSETQIVHKVKYKAPSKQDPLNILQPSIQEKTANTEEPVSKTLPTEDVNKSVGASEESNINEESHLNDDSPRNIISPLLLLNGISANQSPPDQASLSSKSSYFSVESTLHRNTEFDSNMYHSMENLIGELEEVDEEMRSISGKCEKGLERTEIEYYSVSDHEGEPDAGKRPISSPGLENEAPSKETGEDAGKEMDKVSNDSTRHSSTNNVHNPTPMSPSNTLSPSLGIPALFRVKDNTFSHKIVKPIQPWPQTKGLVVSETGEDRLHHTTSDATVTTSSCSNTIPDENLQPKEPLSYQSPFVPLSPSNSFDESQKKSQFGTLLTVPLEDDSNSGVSPSSDGVESLATSMADTCDETVSCTEVTEGKSEVSGVPSERSGSTCSGNDSQTGPPKPPAVLPKSEKALLRAMKLTNRRIKKEEAHNKSSHKSSGSGSKHGVDKPRGDDSEQNSSERKSRSGRSSERHRSSHEKKLREKTKDSHHRGESSSNRHGGVRSEQPHYKREGNSSYSHHHEGLDNTSTRAGKQSHNRGGSGSHGTETLAQVSTERQGRSSNRSIREKPEHRQYSSDRVISNVPVYKAHVGERPTSDRQFQRSQSFDRYLGERTERRLSADMTLNDKLDPRAQRIEKSIINELQQRGRARDRTSKENALKRSHSIDAYAADISHPSTLSRQSSHSSQLSRQSSIDHAIVTQSFPMTQRKLLQDPDSGQYFFVDMPVQVKTKTFFDPEIGTYVQLPVNPSEGGVPQASAMEVLNTPLVLYHSFVPVPLSSIAQKSTIPVSQVEQDEMEQRRLDRMKQMHSKESHPYLEPVYGQHDHVLGEFLGTEELDCIS